LEGVIKKRLDEHVVEPPDHSGGADALADGADGTYPLVDGFIGRGFGFHAFKLTITIYW
jgi:hypothetical protein